MICTLAHFLAKNLAKAVTNIIWLYLVRSSCANSLALFGNIKQLTSRFIVLKCILCIIQPHISPFHAALRILFSEGSIAWSKGFGSVATSKQSQRLGGCDNQVFLSPSKLQPSTSLSYQQGFRTQFIVHSDSVPGIPAMAGQTPTNPVSGTCEDFGGWMMNGFLGQNPL